MIRRAILAALVAFAATESRAQIPDISATPHQLRTMTPAQLGSLLFGAESPIFTDSWVEGPTRRANGIAVELATTPVATGYSGLCAVTTGSGFFDWTSSKSEEDRPTPLVATPFTRSAFLLTSDRPALDAADDGACARRKPLSAPLMAPTLFHVFYSTSPEQYLPVADAAAARFGLLALIAAGKAAESMKVSTERCVTGFADVPAACGDPAAFVRSFYLRHVVGMVIQPCPGAETLCVDAAIEGLGGFGLDHVVIRTGEAEVVGALPTVRSITVRAGSDPVID